LNRSSQSREPVTRIRYGLEAATASGTELDGTVGRTGEFAALCATGVATETTLIDKPSETDPLTRALNLDYCTITELERFILV
jgi:hypothetical protein